MVTSKNGNPTNKRQKRNFEYQRRPGKGGCSIGTGPKTTVKRMGKETFKPDGGNGKDR